MNRWNAVGFIAVNAILLAFFAASTDNQAMSVVAIIFSVLNTMVAVAGGLKR